MIEVTVSLNKIWFVECRENFLVIGVILWVILLFCFLLFFIIRIDKGELDF